MLDDDALDQLDDALGADKVADLASAMIRQARDLVAKIAREADPAARSDLAHSAKGAAASLGASALAEQFKEVEQLGAADPAKLSATIDEAWRALRERYPQLRD